MEKRFGDTGKSFKTLAFFVRTRVGILSEFEFDSNSSAELNYH